MDEKILIQLSELSDAIDKIGLRKQADEIDLLIKSAVGNPASVNNFAEALKKTFTKISENPAAFPSINKQTLPDILKIVDYVNNLGNFPAPDLSAETFKDLGNEVLITVEGLINLNREIPQIELELKASSDPYERQTLQKDLEKTIEKRDALNMKVETWANGRRNDDKQKYEEFVRLMKQKRLQHGI